MCQGGGEGVGKGKEDRRKKGVGEGGVRKPVNLPHGNE